MAKKTRTRKTTTSDNHPTTQYAIDVCEGRIIAGPIVRDACRRHLNDLEKGHERGIAFSEERADHALGFFPRILRLNGGDFEGMPFTLEPAQQFIVGSIFGWVNEDGSRRFRFCYIEQGKGNGKALALDTPIPTPSGWTTMGELSAGDSVLDDSGNECRVVVAHPVSFNSECYRVEFDDGEVIVASAEHLWLTEMRSATRHGEFRATKGVSKSNWGKWRNGLRTTAGIAHTLRYPNGKYQSANHSIALCGALNLPEADLPIEPYTLGVWLGDGDSDCARITIGELDANDGLISLGKVGCEVSQNRKTKRYRISGLQVKLRAAGLLGNKHIPSVYMRASINQRMALLQGLMDTDGYISKSGQCEFTQVNFILAKQVLELALSLGFKATLSHGIAKINGREIGPKYRVIFYPRDDQPCFRLPRKLARQIKRHSRRRLSADRKIVSCEKVNSVPVRCITVDSPSRMFLAGRSMIPTHNSPLVAGIGLYGLIADGEARSEVYAAATKRDQAMILFRDAVAMVDQSPKLSAVLSRSGRGDKVWNLYHMKSSSFFRPISADDGQSGPRPHFGLIDELHEHKSPVVINMMAAGRKGRRQPLIVSITNSGHDVTSVCWEYHQMAIDVCSGKKQDDTFFAYVCALDEDDDPLNDESCWIKANPLLGVTIQHDYLRVEVNQARSMPSKESMVRRLNFCQWTEAHNPLIPMADWEACGEDYTLDIFRGAEVYLGLDLSRTTDLTAAVFVMKKNGKFYWWPEFWLPKDGLIHKAKTDNVPYDIYERNGHLKTTPGRAIDKDMVAKSILDIQSKYSLKFIDAPYDKAFIEEFRMSCGRVGLSLPLSEFQQGFISMAPAVNALETSILNGTMRHNKNPVLRMCAAHAVVSEDPAGNRKFNKDKATGRIDGIVAGSMALVRAMQSQEPAELRIRWA